MIQMLPGRPSSTGRQRRRWRGSVCSSCNWFGWLTMLSPTIVRIFIVTRSSKRFAKVTWPTDKVSRVFYGCLINGISWTGLGRRARMNFVSYHFNYLSTRLDCLSYPSTTGHQVLKILIMVSCKRVFRVVVNVLRPCCLSRSSKEKELINIHTLIPYLIFN